MCQQRTNQVTNKILQKRSNMAWVSALQVPVLVLSLICLFHSEERAGLQTYRSHAQLEQKWRETNTCPAPEIKHTGANPACFQVVFSYSLHWFVYFDKRKENCRTLPQKPLLLLSQIFWLLDMTATWYQHPGALFCQEESLFHLTK